MPDLVNICSLQISNIFGFDCNFSTSKFILIHGGIMSGEILFFSGAGILALITIFLGISNWILLSSLSTKISKLEDEIEKKTSELETLKKERQALAHFQLKGNQQSREGPDQDSGNESGSQQIEIVRNIRGGGFENYDEKANYPQTLPPEQGNESPFAPPAESAASEQQSDVLDVVDETAAASRNAITLFLFSNAKKDTDFTAAWKQLIEILQTRPASRIAIDFSNVLFLYDRELAYLAKFRDAVLQSGGTIAFVNCEAELTAIMQKNPGLARYLNGY
jgi:anti-anti-sigma regulatory factor